MTAPVSAMVLAAGSGTRMRSRRPKPLHRLCGRAMLLYVLDAVVDLGVDRCVVVVGHGAEQITKMLQERGPSAPPLDFVEQTERNGTGHAVSRGLAAFTDAELDVDDATLVVLPGDTPLVRSSTVAELVAHHRAAGAGATVLTADMADPTGYGRIVRSRGGEVARIVEHVDASPDERAISEINTGIFCFRRSVLRTALRRVGDDNAQGELYLTDVVEVLRDAGYPIGAVLADDPLESAGVNDRSQLADVEAELRRRINRSWLAEGVTMVDPDATYVDTGVQLAPDVTLFPNTLLQGDTVIGRGAEIGPDTQLVDCRVGAGATVGHTVARDAEIGADSVVGPFASLAPGSTVADGEVTGAFYTAR